LGAPLRDIAKREPDGAALHLVFAVDAIFRHPLVQELSRQAVPGKTVGVTDAAGVPALALTPGACVPEILTELTQGRPLHETTALAGGNKVHVRGQFIRRFTARSALAGIEHDLLLSLENPRDGFVDTHINRRLSRPLTRWFLRTPITPNQITVLAGLMSILGALCFLPGGYYGPLCGALLFQFSAVLDCCDGEVARVKFAESPLGDWLDIVCDTVGAVVVFIGLGVAVWQDGTTAHALGLAGVLALGGTLAFPLVTLAENTEEAGKRRGGWEDVVIKKLLLSLTNRDFSILIVGCAIIGKLSWFLWGAAVGAQVFWMFLAWLLFRAGRFGRVRNIWERKET
ncbi:MAG: CDP-alcohol phosphatidyltransferase family protein, partial [Candidatus Binatia bacterium]